MTSGISSNENHCRFINNYNLEKYKDGLILLTGGVENGFIGKPASLENKRLANDRLKYLKGVLTSPQKLMKF